MATLTIPQGYSFLDQLVGAGETEVQGELISLTLGDLDGVMTLVQEGRSGFVVYWDLTVAVPVALFRITSEAIVFLGSFPADQRFTEDVVNVERGTFITYALVDQAAATFLTAEIVVTDPGLPFTYGPVAEFTTIRYTTLDAVKTAIGIPDTNADKDPQLTEAIIAGESAIDRELGRSFPDTGSNPQIQTVPVAIENLAKKAAIAVYTGDHTPFGTAGSDEWMGAISVADAVSQTVRRSPLLRGYQVTFGFA